MIVIILPGNAGLTRHSGELWLNIEFIVKLRFRSTKLLHNIASSICTGLPGHRGNDNETVAPNLFKRGRVKILEILHGLLIGYKIIKLQTEDNRMIMRTHRLRTILTSSEKTNTVTKLFP